MNIRSSLLVSSLLFAPATFSVVFTSNVAHADELSDAKSFVAAEHGKLVTVLKKAASPARESELAQKLEAMVDTDEITRRSFGSPCPAAAPGCIDHWKDLTEAQRTEVLGLMKRVIQKNYKKNLDKTLDYDVMFNSSKAGAGGDIKVRSEAKSKTNVREPATQIDYLVRTGNGSLRIVDIVTEGSSLVRNYNDQFHQILTNKAQLYPHLVKKLNEKLAEK